MLIDSGMKINSLLQIIFLFSFGFCIDVISSDKEARSDNLTASALNELRFADGSDISSELKRPWNYFVNTTDIRVGFKRLYLKTQFEVQEPSMGYNPPERVYREHFSRRTIGLETEPLTIEAGHVSTQFGRGLTLSCKEDREVEQYSLLDGVYGILKLPVLSLQAIAGRPYAELNRPRHFLIADTEDNSGSLFSAETADMFFRDLVSGFYAEVFLPVEKKPFSFLSSGSIGGGIVGYGVNVGPLSYAFSDTVNFERPFYYQNRTGLFLPSVTANINISDFGFSFEHAWMKGKIHSYTNSMDPVKGAFESENLTQSGASTYISANALFSGVSLLAEYKNYLYSRNPVFTGDTAKRIGTFLIPPTARYMHAWHLLNKHIPSNLMNDIIGYKLQLNWSPDASSMLTADFSFGGAHDTDSRTRLKKENRYWEAYGEWTQEIGSRINLKMGLDYGRIDADDQPDVTYRTIGFDVNAGPFADRHSFGITLESQVNDKFFLVEKDSAALMNLILETVPPEVLERCESFEDSLEYGDLFIPDNKRSRRRKFAFNLFSAISYHFSQWISVSITLEHETVLTKDDPFPHIITESLSEKHNYASIGVNLKPFPNHTLTVEYGSMSGGKKCTLGTCVEVPPFKGIRMLLTSTI